MVQTRLRRELIELLRFIEADVSHEGVGLQHPGHGICKAGYLGDPVGLFSEQDEPTLSDGSLLNFPAGPGKLVTHGRKESMMVVNQARKDTILRVSGEREQETGNQ